MIPLSSNLSPEWTKIIHSQFDKPYFQKLISDLSDRSGTMVPSFKNVFRSFELTPFNEVRVVIIGQDPYPNPRNATGLAFGVPYGSSLPRSLINIANEIEACLNEPEYDEATKTVIRPEVTVLDRTDMTLEGWAKQGVLLLNSCLTVDEGRSGSHQGMGWEKFTDQVLLFLRGRNKPTVYMLWGEAAQEKYQCLCEDKGQGMSNSTALFASHPSPLSFNKGPLHLRFQGCRHFNRANVFLAKKGQKLVNWKKTGA